MKREKPLALRMIQQFTVSLIRGMSLTFALTSLSSFSQTRFDPNVELAKPLFGGGKTKMSRISRKSSPEPTEVTIVRGLDPKLAPVIQTDPITATPALVDAAPPPPESSNMADKTPEPFFQSEPEVLPTDSTGEADIPIAAEDPDPAPVAPTESVDSSMPEPPSQDSIAQQEDPDAPPPPPQEVPAVMEPSATPSRMPASEAPSDTPSPVEQMEETDALPTDSSSDVPEPTTSDDSELPPLAE